MSLMISVKHMKSDERPWGNWIKFTDNSKSTVKVLEIKPEEQLSFQSHSMRDEFWYVLTGEACVFHGPIKKDWNSIKKELKEITLSVGDYITINRKTVHSIRNTRYAQFVLPSWHAEECTYN